MSTSVKPVGTANDAAIHVAVVFVLGTLLALVASICLLHLTLLQAGSFMPIIAIAMIWIIGTLVGVYNSLRGVKQGLRVMSWILSPIALFLHIHALPNLVTLFLARRNGGEKLVVYASTGFSTSWVFVPIALTSMYFDLLGANEKVLGWSFWLAVIIAGTLLSSDRLFYPVIISIGFVLAMSFIPGVYAKETWLFENLTPPYPRALLVWACLCLIPLHLLSMLYSLLWQRFVITPSSWSLDTLFGGYIDGTTDFVVGGKTKHRMTNLLTDSLCFPIGGCGTLIYKPPGEPSSESDPHAIPDIPMMHRVIGARLMRDFANRMLNPTKVKLYTPPLQDAVA